MFPSNFEHAETHVLPACEGRLVKSLGDGMLLDFAEVRWSVAAAFAIQHEANRANRDVPSDQQLALRMGIEVSEVIIDAHDVYGRGVNIAARLAALAGPGEIVASAQVRDQLTPTLDADVEDLGECFLKHVKEPVRAYRIGPPGSDPVIEPGITVGNLQPTIAVIPFAARDVDQENHVLGEALADELIATLSHSPDLNVISRLSTTAFRGRDVSFERICSHLNSNYVLSGSYRADRQAVVLNVELAEAKSGQIVWTERLTDKINNIFHGDQELINRVIQEVSTAIMARELQRAQSQALPTLKSYTLLMAAIALTHRLSLHAFEEAHHLLQTLIDRATRQPIPLAWMAKWHVLRVQQGWSPDPQLEARLALDCTKRALDTDPHCSLALAMDGFVNTNLLRNLDVGQRSYDAAIETNPNDALAWLLKGTLHGFKGEGPQAVEGTQRALKLSPFDPQRWFYDSLAATAHLAEYQYDRALELAQRSLRGNRTHTSTYRAIAVAQWHLGLEDEARETVRELLRLEPTMTVGGWLNRSPSAPYRTGKEWSETFRLAGVPE